KISEIAAACLRWPGAGFRIREDDRDGLLYMAWILIGTVPAAVVAFTLKDRIESLFDVPEASSVFLVVTGFLLLITRGRSGDRPLTFRTVVLIGLAQAVAILPGCSRSGWTIAVALLAGTGFERAAEFSFMLSIPAILGALLLEAVGGALTLSAGSVFLLVLGTVMAFAAGVFALRLLIYLLKKGSFYRFSWYLIPAGLLSLGYFLTAG
ncbi:MAG TPA: undecaprenyl-diphosphate phosphatase, partial [Candidatus Krumholzibacterium sp.]|nr:undecaprenyl-diphosphate phosphatase [Candidatus Krumholzibacterium sp.]